MRSRSLDVTKPQPRGSLSRPWEAKRDQLSAIAFSETDLINEALGGYELMLQQNSNCCRLRNVT